MQQPDGSLVEREKGTPQGSICKALHIPPYAKKSLMQSNPLKPRIHGIFNTISFA
jgi:hypothetical protein